MATLYHALKSNIYADKTKGMLLEHGIDKTNLNVSNILNLKYNERLFMIFNKKYPYELYINYKTIYNKNTESFGVTSNLNLSLTNTLTTKFNYEFSMRYKNKEEVLSEINEIQMKQQIIYEYLKKENDNIQKIFNDYENKKIMNDMQFKQFALTKQIELINDSKKMQLIDEIKKIIKQNYEENPRKNCILTDDFLNKEYDTLLEGIGLDHTCYGVYYVGTRYLNENYLKIQQIFKDNQDIFKQK